MDLWGANYIHHIASAGLDATSMNGSRGKTKLRIHLKNLRKILDDRLPHLAKNMPHTFVCYVPDQKQIVKEYIYKTVGDQQLKLREGMTFEEVPKCTCDCKIGDMSQFFSE